MAMRWRRAAVNISTWTPTAQEFVAALSRIQAEERDRILRFRFIDDAKSSLVGRLLLRFAIQSELGVSNNDIQLKREQSGRPVLESPKADQLKFNVSHAGAYAVIAVDTGAEIGVDVMDHRRPLHEDVERFFELMTNTFTPSEWTHIKTAASTHLQLLEFYRYWTLKESYIKALGIGLRMDLQRLQFTSDPLLTPAPLNVVDGAVCQVDGQLLTDWTFEQCHLDEKHCVSVCVNRTKTEHAAVPFSFMTAEELIAALEPLREEKDEAAVEAFAQMKVKPPR
eukprot:m.211662 g.211662  ORF g.211662 m.211662 type:complete len:281 (+) comp16942_c0_seq58:122-964(+)